MAIKNVSLDIHAGEILGIAGVAGNGQKELAEAVAGLRKVVGGTITINGEDVTTQGAKARVKKRVGFIPEDRLSMGLVPGMNMEENRILKEFDLPKFSRHHILKKKVIHDTVQEEIKRYDIKTAGDKSPVSLMSGGNQQKVAVAKWLAADCDVYIFDEPTKGVDVGAKQEIFHLINQIAKEGNCVIYATCENSELLSITDRMYVMFDGKIMAELETAKTTEDEIMHYATGSEEKFAG